MGDEHRAVSRIINTLPADSATIPASARSTFHPPPAANTPIRHSVRLTRPTCPTRPIGGAGTSPFVVIPSPPTSNFTKYDILATSTPIRPLFINLVSDTKKATLPVAYSTKSTFRPVSVNSYPNQGTLRHFCNASPSTANATTRFNAQILLTHTSISCPSQKIEASANTFLHP